MDAELPRATHEAPPLAYIDLARRGRTDGWSVAKSILRFLIVFSLTCIVLLLPVDLAWPGAMAAMQNVQSGRTGIFAELAVVAVMTLSLLLGVRSAVTRSLRRPFLTLVSAEARIEGRRVACGAAAWLVAALVAQGALAAATGFGSGLALRMPDARLLLAALAGILVLSVQATTEELVFRGWLTQMIGQWVRSPALVALLTAILFALLHVSPAAPVAASYYVAAALGLSAISLADGRLELAMGAHIAQNLFVLLAALLRAGAVPTLFGATETGIGGAALAAAATQFALIFLLTRWPRFRRLFGLGTKK